MHLLSQLLFCIQNNTRRSSATLTHQNDAADKHYELAMHAGVLHRIRQVSMLYMDLTSLLVSSEVSLGQVGEVPWPVQEGHSLNWGKEKY